MEKLSAEETALAYQLLRLPEVEFEKAAAVAGMSKEAFRGQILSAIGRGLGAIGGGIGRGAGAIGRGIASPFKALARGRTVKAPVEEIPWTMSKGVSASRGAGTLGKRPLGATRQMEMAGEKGMPAVKGSAGSPIPRGTGDKGFNWATGRSVENAAATQGYRQGAGTIGNAASKSHSRLQNAALPGSPRISNIKSAPLPSGVKPTAEELASKGWLKGKLPWIGGGAALGYLGAGDGGSAGGIGQGGPQPNQYYGDMQQQQYGY